MSRVPAGAFRLPARARSFGAELGGFAVVGVFAFAADVGAFLWLRGPVGLDPLLAKAVSFIAGCSVAYAGNALGPYRPRGADGGGAAGSGGGTGGGPGRWRRFGIFVLVNLAGAAVQLACLGISRYGLGCTSVRADLVAGAGVGMALATVLRFWGTRTLVFHAPRAPTL